MDTGDLDTTSDDMRLHRLAAHVSNLGLHVLDLAVVHLRQQTRHVRVHHRREQLRVECRVAETLLETVARVVVAAGVHLRLAQLLLGRHVVPEVRLEDAVDVVLEREDEQDRGDRGEPVERLEGVLQTDGCNALLDYRASTRETAMDILRIMIHCMRMTAKSRRLMTTFHIR